MKEFNVFPIIEGKININDYIKENNLTKAEQESLFHQIIEKYYTFRINFKSVYNYFLPDWKFKNEEHLHRAGNLLKNHIDVVFWFRKMYDELELKSDDVLIR